MSNFIAFDLEGTLTPQDFTRNLMKQFPDGDKIFEVISRYSDLLALEERKDYEPGDMLALIIPFLVLHGITENKIAALASGATLVDGAAKLISWLQSSGWKVFCISATCEQYALHITQKLGIFSHNVACTPFPLDNIRRNLNDEDMAIFQKAETDILAMYPLTSDEIIKDNLDRFFRKELPVTRIGEMIMQVKPVGGHHKVEALTMFANKNNQPPSGWVVVGNSINDFRMFQAADASGGLAIAFNACKYALPYATISLASTRISDLDSVLKAWQKGRMKAVEKAVKEKEKDGGIGDRGYFHWLSGKKDIDDVIKLHERIRQIAR
ncbi:HAD family hydrolase [Chloroflexota bacterium]